MVFLLELIFFSEIESNIFFLVIDILAINSVYRVGICSWRLNIASGSLEMELRYTEDEKRFLLVYPSDWNIFISCTKMMSTDFGVCPYSTGNSDLVVWRDALNEHLPRSLHLPESITACLEARHAWCGLPGLLLYNCTILVNSLPFLVSLLIYKMSILLPLRDTRVKCYSTRKHCT